ncbi:MULTISPECIES: radical SAM family heme chaperone HemW [Anaerolinea]|uniref:radical SAM family heme chaperone HemW n=1 Tax=Anaerolinea TaxID=233189 RepID=UPI0026297FD7|nr:radical SAM family heme chaperone HemW [Anaerolinea thermophila]
MIPVSIYIHIPFCVHRCAYCDFNTYAGMEKWIPSYVDALCKEITLVGNAAPQMFPVHTIFFGGGTPSFIPAIFIQKILTAIRSQFLILEEAEITLEANPGSVEPELLETLRLAGVNRLSIGMQSAVQEELSLLTRTHTPDDVKQSIRFARQAGFENINLDLMFGIPGQTMDTWKYSLDFALSLDPEHLSLYCLTVEEGTPLHQWVEKGKTIMPSEDETAEMYEFSMDYLAEFGFLQYEISNWAKPGKNGEWQMCRHNLQYWNYLPYLGFGAGAHGFFENIRTENVRAIPKYIHQINHLIAQAFPTSPANDRVLKLDFQEQMKEYMMVGLRLTHNGVQLEDFYSRFGVSLLEIFKKEINFLLSRDLIEWCNNQRNLRLTRKGKLLGNQVFIHFV